MSNATILSGAFTSTGQNKFIPLVPGVKRITVYNQTQSAASQTTAVAVQHLWLEDFAQNSKLTTFKSNAANAANLIQYITSNGFQIQDETLNPTGTLNATITGISTATPPVVTTSPAHGLVAGNVVRLYNVTGAQQLGGIDFTVGNGTLTSTTFSLDYMTPIAVATTGSWAKINFSSPFYPRHRYITEISVASEAEVTFSVTHGYQVGQVIRLSVPAAYGMPQIDGMQGTITAVNTTTNTVTLDIDSSSFTAFTFPLSAATPFSPAIAVPVGMDTAIALAEDVDILSDATVNTAEYGMLLVGGANNPAGANNDEIFWVAETWQD